MTASPRGRVVLLLTSPRVAPGLLGWPAWDLLRRADRVVTDDAEHPQRPAVEAAGVRVETYADTPETNPVTGPVTDPATDPVTDPVTDPDGIARDLVAAASNGAEVVWLAADDGAEVGRALGGLLAHQAEAGVRDLPELEVLPASYDLPGARLLDLVEVMDQLRARCPWVQQQTHRSLVRYLVEESAETVEAIETGDRSHLREELGDLLFQVIFHARLAEESPEAPWAIDDVAGDLVEKLIRRNPHVFAAGDATDAAEVESVWDALKAEEKRRTSAVEGVPLGLPALSLADKLLSRTSGSALDLPVAASGQLPPQPSAEEFGDAMLALVDRARAAGVDPEQALRDACRRYVVAVRAAESRDTESAG